MADLGEQTFIPAIHAWMVQKAAACRFKRTTALRAFLSICRHWTEELPLDKARSLLPFYLMGFCDERMMEEEGRVQASSYSPFPRATLLFAFGVMQTMHFIKSPIT